MDWRLQAYQLLHQQERPPEPKLSRCKVLSLFEDRVNSSNEAAQEVVDQEVLDQELGVWLKDLKPKDPKQKKNPQSRKNGFSILLCGRPERVHDDFNDGHDVRAGFSNIPFNEVTPEYNSLEDAVKAALEYFQVHTHMGQVLKRRKPYFSVAYIKEGKIAVLIRSYIKLMAAPFPAGTEKTVYTAGFDTGIAGFKENLAFTSTYFHANENSFGIILGCTEGLVKKATALLTECKKTSRSHQLLLPAVFLELQRQHLENIGKKFTKKALELQGDFREIRDHKNGQTRFKFGNQPRAVADCTKVLSELRDDSNIMAEDIKIALRQLSRLKRHAEELAQRQDEELKKLKESPEAKAKRLALDNTHCFLDIFEEIADDVERVSGEVTVNAEAATMTSDEMTRSTLKQETRWSMGLAFVAMAYLPITALATIFALPVFDFKARWRDMGNRPANWSESSGGDGLASVSPSSSPPPVMSIYFTYWISMSTVLTWLTIETWWVFSSEVEEWRWDRVLSLRLLAQAAEPVIKILSWVCGWLRETWIFQKFGEIWASVLKYRREKDWKLPCSKPRDQE